MTECVGIRSQYKDLMTLTIGDDDAMSKMGDLPGEGCRVAGGMV